MKIAMLGPADTVHFRRLVRALAERGHQVHVVSMKPDPIEGATFERFAVPPFGWRFPFRWRKRWAAHLKNLFRRHDVVDVHFLADWGITEAVARTGRLVATVYGSDVDHPPDSPPPDPALVAARKQLLQCADAVVTPSRWCAGLVTRFADIVHNRIVVLPFGVDTSQFAPRGEAADVPPIVGYFKGFEPVYDPMTVVEAAAIVHLRRPDVRFEFVGDGRLRDACRRRVEELGLTPVIRWIDRQPHETMPDVLARWSVVAISSLKESFCVAAIEAAAMGLPVVATDVGGLRESMADGSTGLLVPPNHCDALAAGLLKVLDDRASRLGMGQAGRRWAVERFEWRDCVDKWISLYEHVCAGDSRRAGASVQADIPLIPVVGR